MDKSLFQEYKEMIQCQTVIESKLVDHHKERTIRGNFLLIEKMFFQSAPTKSPGIEYWLTQPVGRMFTDTPTEISLFDVLCTLCHTVGR